MMFTIGTIFGALLLVSLSFAGAFAGHRILIFVAGLSRGGPR